MGCDIHMYLEYKEKDSTRWQSFGGRFNCGRYYGVFARLAGVRGEGGEPKGRVKDMSYSAAGDDRLYICDRAGGDQVTEEKAKDWVDKGHSQYIYRSDDEMMAGKPTWVTSPDNHSHSWATIEELEAAIDGMNGAVEYEAFVAAMRSFASNGLDVRCVYWFDN